MRRGGRPDCGDVGRFRSQPDAVPAEGVRDLQDDDVQAQTVKPPTSTAEVNRFLKQALPIFTAQYLALRRLSVPRSLRVLHGRALTAEKLQLDGIRAGIKNLDAGADPTATFNAMDKKLSPIGDAEDAAWRKLHIAACVSVG